jgi:transcriptional regulator with XRE-family HTH domain
MQPGQTIQATRRRLIDQLRRGRGRLGLTQEDLADALGVVRATVVKLEAGEPSPMLDNLIRALHLVGYELLAVPGDHPLTLQALHDAEPRPVPQRVNRAP